jgi:hypothetical protein
MCNILNLRIDFYNIAERETHLIVLRVHNLLVDCFPVLLGLVSAKEVPLDAY